MMYLFYLMLFSLIGFTTPQTPNKTNFNSPEAEMSAMEIDHSSKVYEGMKDGNGTSDNGGR